MKIRLFVSLMLLLLLMSFSTLSQATCIPAPDPDLNNDGIVNCELCSKANRGEEYEKLL